MQHKQRKMKVDSRTLKALGVATLLTFTFSLSTLIAQNDTMYVMKNGSISYKQAVSDVDSVIFYKSSGIPSLKTLEIGSITPTSAVSWSIIIDNGEGEIIEKGICWDTTDTPTTNDNKTLEGNGSIAYSRNLTGLTPNDTYYARSYAINTADTAYGNEISFMTLVKISTNNATLLSYSSFNTGGTIDAGGGETVTERGIVYGFNSNPTKADNFVTSGSGTGSFTATLTSLLDTGYYFRAYAVNAGGISYGPEKSFPKRKKTIEFNGTLYIYPEDNSTGIHWSNGSDINTKATSTTDGAANTDSIVKHQGSGAYAAYLCDTLTAFGHNDWYLPAKDELNAMYQNKATIGGFSSDNYWSSTENVSNLAEKQNFSSGNQSIDLKDSDSRVRCVRRD